MRRGSQIMVCAFCIERWFCYTTEPAAMGALLAQLGLVGTEVLDTVGDVAGVIVGNPLLLLTVGFLFIGGVIGIFGRLLSRG